MIIVLILLAIWGFTWYLAIRVDDEWFGGVLFIGVTIFLAWLIPFWASYNTYVECRAFYDTTHKQYADNIQVYKEAAMIEFKSSSLTDLKYQNYQTEIGKDIGDLQKNIKYYNKMIISKRLYGNNPLFSWFIVKPDDDMKELRYEVAQFNGTTQSE